MSLPRRSDLLRLAEEICEEEGVPIPTLNFIYSHKNQCHETHIDLASPDWMADNYGVGEHEGYPLHYVSDCLQLTLIHELAHWIERQTGDGSTRHSPFMYATYFRLAAARAFDMDVVLGIEAGYKPRASVAGWKLYQQWVAEAAA